MNKRMNVLVVNGDSSGRFYQETLRRRGYLPFHLKTGEYLYDIDESAYEKNFYYDGNIDKCADKLKEYDFKGIITGCEGSVVIREQLCQKLNMAYNGKNNPKVLTDKFLMQQALKNAGLNHIDSFVADSVLEALSIYEQTGLYQVVVKPLNSNGTINVHICSSKQEVKSAAQAILNNGKNASKILIQEYINGKEYVINHVSKKGKHCLTDIWEYDKIEIDGRPIYNYVSLVRKLTPNLSKAVKYIEAVLDVLGVVIGPTHAEVKIDNGKPVLIEIGARLMGGLIPPVLLPEAGDRHPIELAIDSYLSDERHLENIKRFKNYDENFNISILAKFIISNIERKTKKVPKFSVINRLQTFRAIDYTMLIKSGGFVKTTDIDTSPGMVLLIDKDATKVKTDYNYLRFIESNALYLLYKDDTDSNITIKGKNLLDFLNI